MQNNALIIGYGASGKAAELLLKKQGFTVFIFDDQELDRQVNQVFIEQFKSLDLKIVILSPGICPSHKACLEIKRLQVPLLGEAEFALSFLPQRKIGITGTNGKTTVTYLCEHILNIAGFQAIACGNVSKQKALSVIALDCPEEAVLCVELSSFQLETLNTPRFETGVVLNITPDHLDRYHDMQDYAKAKFRLRDLSDKFYVFKSVAEQFTAQIDSSDIIYDIGLNQDFLSIDFASYIDKINFISAYYLLKPFHISDDLFIKAFTTFKKPPHRLEKIAQISGIDFINDSKSTNIDATIQALRSMTQPVILLVGGVDKGHPYLDWIPYLKSVKKLVCFGACRKIIYSQLASVVSSYMASSLQEAINYAYSEASPGDVVLLSPGCSSFDEFKDYQDRGEKFCQNVHKLQPKEILL